MALSSPASVAHGRTLPEGAKAVPVRTLSPERRALARTSRRHPSGVGPTAHPLSRNCPKAGCA
jgi:hypothetical protein